MTKGTIYTFIQEAMRFGVRYVFVDKGSVPDETLEHLKKHNYSVVVGQGEVARIKISW